MSFLMTQPQRGSTTANELVTAVVPTAVDDVFATTTVRFAYHARWRGR